MQVVFLEPLRALAGTPQQLLSEKALATLFSNLEDLVRLNKELLAALTARIETSEWEKRSHSLGDVFLRISPFLKLYSIYVSNCTCRVRAAAVTAQLTPTVPRSLQMTRRSRHSMTFKSRMRPLQHF